ncbi:hypothetical protein [Aeromonas jandaei]|uniref:hypothetical protein n=1 Tax=Aeromonas jandaei TaxID=650 RepID=UPI001ABFC68F|nr:hypothetical protein [Aeromonas jandaei]QSR70922.1 hypothetical protein GP488_17570 [Aeromonas jandaei]
MHAAVLTAGQIFINDLTNKVSWAVRLTHGSPQKSVTGGSCAGWHPHPPAVKPDMIPHYAPCLNLNLAVPGYWRAKKRVKAASSRRMYKKAPHKAGLKVMKNKTDNTHTTKAHTHSQPFPNQIDHRPWERRVLRPTLRYDM